MIANYHTHTWRCNHAQGREEDYVLSGIRRGLKILGFSDHTPYFFPDGYRSTFRMRPDQLDDYVSTVLALREKYADQILIPLGLETEYYPAFFPELISVLRNYPMDYLILGQHYIENEMDAAYSGQATDDERILVCYCDQVISAMETGLFTYLAHPDLIHFIGSRRAYEENMRRVCRSARDCGMPLEINLLGLQDGRHYPNRAFWEIAAEEDCPCILGCDAHEAGSLLDVATEEKAMKKAEELGLKVLKTAVLRPLDREDVYLRRNFQNLEFSAK